MTYLSRAISRTFNNITEAIRKAVPAYSGTGKRKPGWPNPARPIDPYHFMRPIPLPVKTHSRR